MRVAATLALIQLSSGFLLRQGSTRPFNHPLDNGAGKCDVHMVEQPLDHFNRYHVTGAPSTYKERVFTCTVNNRPIESVWFYAGNEANVELYLNHTGLMWENADAFNAVLVFAEHRYFGDSLPPGNPTANYSDPAYIQYLSAEQALEDYAYLLRHYLPTALRYNASRVPAIGFGGSYGGMLTAWLRMRYPTALAGGIAASAPIISYAGMEPEVDYAYFTRILTWATTPAAGGVAGCSTHVSFIWPLLDMISILGDESALADVTRAFKLCSPLKTTEDVMRLSHWIQDAYPNLGMGAFPFPSSYMTNGVGTLPPYPLNEACKRLVVADVPGVAAMAPLRAAQARAAAAGITATKHSGVRSIGTRAAAGNVHDTLSSSSSSSHTEKGLNGEVIDFLYAVANSVGVLYNVSDAPVSCHDINVVGNNESTVAGLLWGYLYCVSSPMVDASTGMMPIYDYNLTAVKESCMRDYGVDPILSAVVDRYSGRAFVKTTSNLFFSNGELDPWRGGGVTESNLDRDIIAHNIPRMGHHADLMFSTPQDTEALATARVMELRYIGKWIREFKSQL